MTTPRRPDEFRLVEMDEVDSTIAQLQAEIESLRTNDRQR